MLGYPCAKNPLLYAQREAACGNMLNFKILFMSVSYPFSKSANNATELCSEKIRNLLENLKLGLAEGLGSGQNRGWSFDVNGDSLRKHRSRKTTL